MLGPMPPRFRQPIALLLIAVMAMLPLQALLASTAGGDNTEHCRHAAQTAPVVDHGTHGHHADCCKTVPSAPAAADQQSACDAGCDHCCSAGGLAILSVADLDSPAVPSGTPRLLSDSGQPLQSPTTLLRPPQVRL